MDQKESGTFFVNPVLNGTGFDILTFLEVFPLLLNGILHLIFFRNKPKTEIVLFDRQNISWRNVNIK